MNSITLSRWHKTDYWVSVRSFLSYILALGDRNSILDHFLSEWTNQTPFYRSNAWSCCYRFLFVSLHPFTYIPFITPFPTGNERSKVSSEHTLDRAHAWSFHFQQSMYWSWPEAKHFLIKFLTLFTVNSAFTLLFFDTPYFVFCENNMTRDPQNTYLRTFL